MSAATDTTTQIYQVFIKASPEQIWAAITKPDYTARYFHGARIENTPDQHFSRGPDGSIWADEKVVEFDPPRRLVHEWRSLYDPELAQEPASRVTWEIEPQEAAIACSPSPTTSSTDHRRPPPASPARAGCSCSAG